jgi:hypothetical protein
MLERSFYLLFHQSLLSLFSYYDAPDQEEFFRAAQTVSPFSAERPSTSTAPTMRSNTAIDSCQICYTQLPAHVSSCVLAQLSLAIVLAGNGVA